MLSNLIQPSFLDNAIVAQVSLVVHLETLDSLDAREDLIDLLLAYERITGQPHAVDAILPDLEDPTLGRKAWRDLVRSRVCTHTCAS